MTILTVIFVIIALMPTFFYTIQNGKNPAALVRGYMGAEIYGLKIIQMFIPVSSHGIPKLQHLISSYYNSTPLPLECPSLYLGIIGIIGFLILVCFIFIKEFDNKTHKEVIKKEYIELKDNLKFISYLNIAAILLATVGGFSSLFSILISPAIRGYNRISIFIMYISILAVCFILSFIYNKSGNKKIFAVSCVVIFSLGIFEQFPGNPPDYKLAKALYMSDDNFVKIIEKNVPKGSMIFQLPYHQFPEAGPVNGMSDYNLFGGYLHSDKLKWSYGGMKGRRSDKWNEYVSSLDLEDMIKTISIAGFEGIYIDKRAYTEEEYNKLENQLKSVIKTNPVYSENDDLSFFNMNSYNKKYRSLYTESELDKTKQNVLSLSNFKLGKGFTAIEGEKPEQWIWLSNDAEIIKYNYSNEEKEYKFSFDILSGSPDKSDLKIFFNGELIGEYDIDLNGIRVDKAVMLKSGENSIGFVTDAPRIDAPGDPRELYLRIINFNFADNNYNLK